MNSLTLIVNRKDVIDEVVIKCRAHQTMVAVRGVVYREIDPEEMDADKVSCLHYQKKCLHYQKKNTHTLTESLDLFFSYYRPFAKSNSLK